MDKEEILAKNKRSGLDEREQRVYNRSFGLGAVTVCVLCCIFGIIKLFNHEKFYEYGAIMTAYLCTTFIYQYKNLRKPVYLVFGICTGVGALLLTALFLMEYIRL